MFTVRPYTDADYDDFIRIDSTTQSRAFWSEADWHPIHPPCDETAGARRYVIIHTESAQIIGYGAIKWSNDSNIDAMIDPTWQRRGVGTALWQRMRDDLSTLGAVTIGPWVRAENSKACRWLESLGFTQVHQDGAVQLIVANADLTAFDTVIAEMAAQGITLTTLAAEQGRVPNARERFYQLFRAVEKDVPGYTPERAMTYAQCVEELEQPGMVPESFFIAMHNGEYVGLSILRRHITENDLRFAGGNSMSQHLTGVRRGYRRRGIAHALKLHTMEYARRHGYSRILSNSDNPAMQKLNEKLGFRTGPWLIYNRKINDEQK